MRVTNLHACEFVKMGLLINLWFLFYAFQHFMHCNVWHDKNLCSTNLCNLRLTRILLIHILNNFTPKIVALQHIIVIYISICMHKLTSNWSSWGLLHFGSATSLLNWFSRVRKNSLGSSTIQSHTTCLANSLTPTDELSWPSCWKSPPGE